MLMSIVLFEKSFLNIVAITFTALVFTEWLMVCYSLYTMLADLVLVTGCYRNPYLEQNDVFGSISVCWPVCCFRIHSEILFRFHICLYVDFCSQGQFGHIGVVLPCNTRQLSVKKAEAFSLQQVALKLCKHRINFVMTLYVMMKEAPLEVTYRSSSLCPVL